MSRFLNELLYMYPALRLSSLYDMTNSGKTIGRKTPSSKGEVLLPLLAGLMFTGQGGYHIHCYTLHDNSIKSKINSQGIQNHPDIQQAKILWSSDNQKLETDNP